MRYNIVYSSHGSLEKIIKRKKIIPYKLFPYEKLVKGKWYYDSRFNNIFKIVEVEYKDGILDHAIIVTDEGFTSYISTPLDFYNDYRIEFDKRNIVEQDIINSHKSFYGAEIRYWFYMNNIDSFNRKYRDFWQFLEETSDNKINDNSKYLLFGDLRNGTYFNCKVIRLANRRKPTKEEIKKNDKFMKDLKQKDMKEVIRLHEKNNDPED